MEFIHVFLLMVYLGTGDERRLTSGDMYFYNIDECNYFAKRVSQQYGNYFYKDLVDPKDRVTAYCLPKYISKNKKGINIY